MLSVIVNPAAGGGRPKRSLPAVRAELTRLGLEHEVHATTSLAHAKQLASQTAAEGKLPVAFGGDGLVGAVAGALAHNHSA
ncbi:MAG: acylglycerol kinase family protein, partial [Solirubrobacterales bacterium]|nr:acylglycerol kinase family protein [Solirubrobacterales bacterium]